MRCGQAAFGALGGSGGLGWAGLYNFPNQDFKPPLQGLDLFLERNDPPQVVTESSESDFIGSRRCLQIMGVKLFGRVLTHEKIARNRQIL